MEKATEALEAFQITYNIDKTDIESTTEEITVLYVAMRLEPIIGVYDINENRYNNICNNVVNANMQHNISLDLIINSVYNYINEEKHGPSDKLLTTDIEKFLEDYSEEL